MSSIFDLASRVDRISLVGGCNATRRGPVSSPSSSFHSNASLPRASRSEGSG